MISQYPYEGCIVRKDLMPATLRRLSPAAAAAGGASGPASWHPPSLPATYDLATEPHFFLADYDRVWLIRPSLRPAKARDRLCVIVCLSTDQGARRPAAFGDINRPESDSCGGDRRWTYSPKLHGQAAKTGSSLEVVRGRGLHVVSIAPLSAPFHRQQCAIDPASSDP